MKKILVILILCLGTGMPSWAVYNLTASNVSIADCSVKQPNYYFDITASTSQATYHVCLDVWPTQASIVGSFSTDNGTITRGFSSLRKGSSTYYYMYDDCPISLTITKINNDTCELSAHFKAARGEDETRYEYDIAPFRFAYKAGDTPDDPTLDPYRFEPATPTTQTFEGQVVEINDYRSTSGCINIHLIDSVNQQLDWIELNLVTTTYNMPVGTYTFSADSANNTLVASPGYRQHEDQPSYIALRGTDWGQYTPYYIADGSLTFSLNTTGDTVTVSGSVTTQHGSSFTIDVVAYNPLYIPPIPPRPQEEKELSIDSVVITYVGETEGKHNYEMNFSYQQDYPNLIFNLWLPTAYQLAEGTYTLEQNEIEGILLFQNQDDFNQFLYEGTNYVFVTFSLSLTNLGNNIWRYSLDMIDDIGSHYYFTLDQNPHLASPAALPTIESKRSTQKVLRLGHIEIMRNGKRYSILGHLL